MPEIEMMTNNDMDNLVFLYSIEYMLVEVSQSYVIVVDDAFE